MKINYKKTLASIVSLCIVTVLFFPVMSIFAQDVPTDGSRAPTIVNPLGPGNNSVQALLLKIMNLVALVGGIVVVFLIILSGYKFVTAGDSDSDRTDAKKTFYATVIGGAILLGADVIANVVVNTVNTTVGRAP